MRILFIITRGDTVGGASIHVRDMSRRLLDEGHAVHVLVGNGKAVPDIFEAKEVPYTKIPSLVRSLKPTKDLSALYKTIKFICRWKPDLVSTHTSKAGAIGRVAAKFLKVPVLYTPHCWSFADNFPRAGLYLKIERLLAWTTTRFISVSEYERQLGLQNGVCLADNSVTIHNGMPDTELPPKRPSVEAEPVRLIMVARFDEQKDHRSLIIALDRIKDLDWTLTFVGDGPLEPEIRQLAEVKQLTDRITFAGYSSAVQDLLCRMQVFILSTHWESFPRSILEAMRSGLPIISSDVGGCSESVAHGVNGYVVPPNDPSALAEYLRQIICDQDKRQAMGQASRRKYEKAFTFDRMYAQYIDLYRQILSQRNVKEQK